MISPSSSIASSQPATSAKVVFGVSLVTSLAFDLAKLITREPPPCMEFIRKMNTTAISRNGISVENTWPMKLGFGFSTSYRSTLPLSNSDCRSLPRFSAWPSTQWARSLVPSVFSTRIS